MPVEGLALEPVGGGPDIDHRRHHRQVVIRAKHANPDALVVRNRQQVRHHSKTGALPGAIAIVGIIHAAQVDQLLEAAIGMIAQGAHGGRIGLRPDDQRQLVQSIDDLDERIAENIFQTNGK